MSSQYFILVFCMVLSSCTQTLCARILITTGTNFGSHFSILSLVGKALHDHGHSITALISNAYEDKATGDPKYAYLKYEVFSEGEPEVTRNWPKLYANYVVQKRASSSLGMLFHSVPPKLTSLVTNCWDMIKYFEGKDTLYDLFIVDGHSPCSLFLAGYLGIPYVILIPSGIKPSLARKHGVADTAPYYPEMSTGLTDHMSFRERVSNFFTGVYDDASIFVGYDLLPFVLSTKYKINVSIRNLVSDAQLILVNTDFAVDFPFPMHPNVKPVGGLSTRPKDKLEKNWDAYMNSSGKHGVVLFTLGTYSSSVLSLEDMDKFARAFAAIPQSVVWQMKEDPPAALQLGRNTRIVQWMPQNDLLGHPNMKALVFHAGNNGMYEALYHGVPMVVMPLIFDHPDVAARVINRGMGVMVDFFSFTSHDLTKAINEVISNTSYRENTRRISRIFRANPQPPLERAVFWVEHVLEFGGDYLRSSRSELYFWQTRSLDVYAFFILVAYLIYRLVKFGYLHNYHRKAPGALLMCIKTLLCVLIRAFLLVCPRLRLNTSGSLWSYYRSGRATNGNAKV